MDVGALVNDVYQSLGQGMDYYQTFMKANPVIGNMLTSQVTFPIADVISQLVTYGKVNMKKVGFTALNAPLYGLGLYGLIESGELVGQVISDAPVVKSALGPNLLGNLLNAYFYINNAIGRVEKYGINAFKEQWKNYARIFHYDKTEKPKFKGFINNLKEKTLDKISWFHYKWFALFPTLTLWEGIQTFNYGEMPEELRTPLVIFSSIVWLPFLTYASDKAAAKIDRAKSKEKP